MMRPISMTLQAGDILILFRQTRSEKNNMYYEGVKMYDALPTDNESGKKI